MSYHTALISVALMLAYQRADPTCRHGRKRTHTPLSALVPSETFLGGLVLKMH